jgi:hypothetical protein
MNEWKTIAVTVTDLQDRRPLSRVSTLERDEKCLLHVVYSINSSFKETTVVNFVSGLRLQLGNFEHKARIYSV